MRYTNRDFLSQTKKIELIQKMIALPTITLSAQEADRFIEMVWDESVLKGNARLVKMDSETKNVRALGFGTTRILHPKSTFTQSDYKSAYEHDLIELSAKRLRCCVVIFDSDLEDLNVGTAAEFKSQIMSMTAKQLATELEELYIIGDDQSLSGFASTDARSVVAGWRYRLDHSQSGESYENDVTGSTIVLDASNIVSAIAESFDLTTSQGIVERDANAPYDQEYKFDLMIEQMPSKYKQGKEGLSRFRFFCNDQIASRYVKGLSKRATILGDQAIQGKSALQYGTIPIVSVPQMPTEMIIASGDVQHEKLDTSTPGDLTDCILTRWDNFVIGMQKKLTLETAREAADQANYFYYDLAVDPAIQNVNEAVLLKRLKIA